MWSVVYPMIFVFLTSSQVMNKDHTLSTKVVEDQAIPTELAKIIMSHRLKMILVIQQTFTGLLVSANHCGKYKDK